MPERESVNPLEFFREDVYNYLVDQGMDVVKYNDIYRDGSLVYSEPAMVGWLADADLDSLLTLMGYNSVDEYIRDNWSEREESTVFEALQWLSGGWLMDKMTLANKEQDVD